MLARRHFMKGLAIAPVTMVSEEKERVVVQSHLYPSSYLGSPGFYVWFDSKETRGRSREASRRLHNLPEEGRPVAITIHKDGMDVRFV